MKRCALFLLLLTAVAGSMACGFIGGSSPEGPEGLVPDGARELVLVDISEAALNHTDLPMEFENRVSNLENYGDVRQQAALTLASGHVLITSGDFDFQDIRDDLDNSGYAFSLNRGYDYRVSANSGQASALLADDGYLISGDIEAVSDVLRDVNRDTGLLWNDDGGELKQALDIVGAGLVKTASRDCRHGTNPENNHGCLAAAWAFSRGEDRRTVIEGTAAFLFRDASTASAAAPIIERAINSNELIALTQIITDENTVTLKADINRDDFASLQFPINLGQ